jgi:glutaminyl-tRNA synthetase
VTELHCTYDPATKGGNAPDGRSPKATIHWVSAAHAVRAEVRLYDRLFTLENPDSAGNFLNAINPNSIAVISGCCLEPGLAEAAPGDRMQFERLGYFCIDTDSKSGSLVVNRTVTLRDDWTKIQKRDGK